MTFLFKLGASMLGWYLKRYAKNEAAKKDYLEFVEIMTRSGLSTTKARLDAENQKDRIKNDWKENV